MSNQGEEMGAPDPEALASWAMVDPRRAEELLRRFPEAIRAVTVHTRETALHWAIIERMAQAVRLLLAHGAEVNAPRCLRWHTPPQCHPGGSDELLDLLLQSGADPGTGSQSGEVPLLVCVEARRPDLVRRLL